MKKLNKKLLMKVFSGCRIIKTIHKAITKGFRTTDAIANTKNRFNSKVHSQLQAKYVPSESTPKGIEPMF